MVICVSEAGHSVHVEKSAKSMEQVGTFGPDSASASFEVTVTVKFPPLSVLTASPNSRIGGVLSTVQGSITRDELPWTSVPLTVSVKVLPFSPQSLRSLNWIGTPG